MFSKLSVDERIRQSEPFFRIRDTEKKMKEIARLDKVRRAKKKKPKGVVEVPVEQEVMYSQFTVNDNPKYSKFFLYDYVAFPCIVNKTILPPASIDDYWMSGFQDRQLRDASKISEEKRFAAIKAAEHRAILPSIESVSGSSGAAQKSCSSTVTSKVSKANNFFPKSKANAPPRVARDDFLFLEQGLPQR